MEQSTEGNSKRIDAVAQFRKNVESFNLDGYTYTHRTWSPEEQAQSSIELTNPRIVLRSINNSFYMVEKIAQPNTAPDDSPEERWIVSKVDDSGQTTFRQETIKSPLLTFNRARNEMLVTMSKYDGVHATQLNLEVTEVFLGQPLTPESTTETYASEVNTMDVIKQLGYKVIDDPQRIPYVGTESLEGGNRPTYEVASGEAQVLDIKNAPEGTIVTIGRNRHEDTKGTHRGIAVHIATKQFPRGEKFADNNISREAGIIQVEADHSLRFIKRSERNPMECFTIAKEGLLPTAPTNIALSEGLVVKIIGGHDIDPNSKDPTDLLCLRSGQLKYPPEYLYFKQNGDQLLILRVDDEAKVKQLAQQLAK